MDRRRILLMTFASLAASPVLAQSTSPSNPSTSPGEVGDAEKAHVRDTLEVGTLSLELSRLALARASDAKVKEFANFEVAEQETIGGILKPMLEGAPPADPTQAEMLKKLQDAGARFDRDYVDAEIEGHNKLMAIQVKYLAEGKNQPQLDIAKLARGMITEHLALLADLQKGGLHG